MDEKISGLQELALPTPVSYMPQTIGWYILLAVLLVAMALLIRRWLQHRAANRYRRDALGRLDEIVSHANEPAAVAALPALVKRTALSFAPREDVAQLSGDAWLAYLDSTYGGNGFTTGPGKLLPALSYGSRAALPPNQVEELFTLIREWIRRHHARI